MSTELTLNPEKDDKTLLPEEIEKVNAYKNEIDFSKSDQIIQYGTSAQNRMTTFADSVLNTVRAKDMGEIGKMITDLTIDLKNFDETTNKKGGGFLGLFNSTKKKVARLKSEYSKVETNISQIEVQLEKQSKNLLKDIYIFDQQYQENWNFYREITLYIQAGDEKIKEMREQVLPEMQAKMQESNDPSEAQKYRDLEQQVVRFEKKVHDLKLSRMISIQLAPQIRLVQNNSATMIDKIQSIIANTLPLWKNQMVLSLGIAHTQEALAAQKAVTDTTNELLRKNSEMLKQSTVEIATESERSIVDFETIKKANDDLFQAMDDLVRIQAEGREKRLAVEVELKAAEEEMKNKLLANAPNKLSANNQNKLTN